MNKSQTVVINDDLILEIHHNPSLTNKPFQLRIYGFSCYEDYRLSNKDMINFGQTIIDFAFNNNQNLEASHD